MAWVIKNDTEITTRRIKDGGQYFNRDRVVAVKPGTGSVLIKFSFDQGATYDVVKTFTGAPEVFEFSTVDHYIEIECVGDAICVLGR